MILILSLRPRRRLATISRFGSSSIDNHPCRCLSRLETPDSHPCHWALLSLSLSLSSAESGEAKSRRPGGRGGELVRPWGRGRMGMSARLGIWVRSWAGEATNGNSGGRVIPLVACTMNITDDGRFVSKRRGMAGLAVGVSATGNARWLRQGLFQRRR